MKNRTQLILGIMNVLFWIVFIGLCIKTGSILYSFFVSLAINPVAAKDLYLSLNLSELRDFSHQHYITVASILVVLTAMKAYIAYLVVKISLKFRLVHPFSKEVAKLIAKISHVALATGILALAAQAYSDWLIKKGPAIPIDWGAGETLFLAGIIFIIAQVFKKGIEIQTENELTV